MMTAKTYNGKNYNSNGKNYNSNGKNHNSNGKDLQQQKFEMFRFLEEQVTAEAGKEPQGLLSLDPAKSVFVLLLREGGF